MTAPHQCDARVSPKYGGHRCQFKAKHRHETVLGVAPVVLHLCTPHFRVLVHRGHLGPEEDLVKRWIAE